MHSNIKRYKMDDYTFRIGDKIQYQFLGIKSKPCDTHVISNITFGSNNGAVRIYYDNGSWDYLSSVVESLDNGEMLLIPAIQKSKQKASTTCECKELKLQIATLQKKNEELTNALTGLAEKAMNAAGWKRKLELKEK
jgi:hypothetical protein